MPPIDPIPAGPDRRAFLRRGGLAAGGLAVFGRTRADDHPAAPKAGDRPDPMQDCIPWPPPPVTPYSFRPDRKLPQRVRKSAFELSDDEAKRLRKAYQMLRQLTDKNPDDPRGWLRQANVHCWYCGGEGGDGINATVEIHGSWRFLPWHRMYLYFHERILAALLEDDTFTLPYWDWDTPGRNQLPPAYAEEKVNGEPNPLFDPNRGAKPGDLIPDDIVGPVAIAQAIAPLGYDTPGGFGGTPDGGDVQPSKTDPNGSAGTLESNPHGPVHIWTGDPALQAAKPDMGILATAARDPIFFSHHANIDRFWDVWLSQPQKPGEPKRMNPRDSNWYIQRFTFYDQHPKPNWVAMSIADTVNSVRSLHYRYDKVTTPAATPPKTFLLAGGEAAPPLTAGEPTKPVPVPEGVRAALVGKAPEAPTPPPLVVLHVDGINVPPDQQARFRVFVNKPDADEKTPITDAHFVGVVTVLAKHAPGKNAAAMHGAKHPPQNAAFEIRGELSKSLAAENAQVSVKLVPLGGTQKVTYRKAYLSVEKLPG